VSAAPGGIAPPVSHRALVTDLRVRRLPDGRWEILADGQFPDGSPVGLSLRGHCHLPAVGGGLDPYAPSFLLEVVPHFTDADADWADVVRERSAAADAAGS
jgi:hypothetical protein